MSIATPSHDRSQDTIDSRESCQKDLPAPDFSYLPDIVWLAVLKLLTVQQRYHLSQTCKLLQAVFSDPSVWTSIILKTKKECNRDEKCYERAFLLPWQKTVLEKFGHCIQHVTVEIPAVHLDKESYSSLLSLATGKAVRSFTVKQREQSLLSTHFFEQLAEDDAEETNMYQLISAVAGKWPERTLHIDFDFYSEVLSFYLEVLACSPSDVRCQHVRSLKIKNRNCTEELLQIRSNPPKSSPTVELVSMFPFLQHLSLADFAFSDQLLYTLADMSRKRGMLRTLTVDFNTSEERYGAQMSDVSSVAWSQLVDACPQLEVSCSFFSFYSVERILKPEAPLVGIQISSESDGQIDLDAFESFCFDHHATLRKLRYAVSSLVLWKYHGGKPEELPVLAVVKGCPGLVHLSYKGFIDRNCVIGLSKVTRRWETLELSGDVKIRDGQTNEIDATVEELKELEGIMSWSLGFKWKFHGHSQY